jgi:ABC-type phosphate transport system permease subunit
MDVPGALPPQVLLATRTLGAPPWRVFWRVELPLITPALQRGMAFAAASYVGEFALSLFLLRPERAPLTTLIYQTLSRSGFANLDAPLVMGCVLMVLGLAGVLITQPSLLLLDEPFSALNTDVRAAIQARFSLKIAASNIVVVLVIHDETEARRMPTSS